MSATAKPEKGTAVERIDPKLALIKSRLERLQPSFDQVLPEYLTPERMVRLALLAINRQPELLACTAESISESVMQISAWGLEIGRTAYLIAYKDKCTAQADYKGKIELAIRSHTITSCRARVVYERDEFTVEYGLVERLIHRPAWNADRGKPIGVYAVVMLPGSEAKFELMSAAEVEKIRQRSKAKDSGPWKTDPEEMWKKTVVHRILKMIPQSPLLAAAFEAEEHEEPEMVTVRQTAHVREDGYSASGAAAFAGKAEVKSVDAFRKPSGPPAKDPYISAEEQRAQELAEDARLAAEDVEQEGRS